MDLNFAKRGREGEYVCTVGYKIASEEGIWRE
jgi:hypothetical protein